MEFIKQSKWFVRSSDLAKYLVLLRQFNAINTLIGGLNAAQRRQIAMVALEELAQSEVSELVPAAEEARKWQAEATKIFVRTRSPHSFIHVPAIQRWMVCAYRATFNSPYGEVQNLHRAVLRSLRQLQGDTPIRSSDIRNDLRRYA